MTGWRGAAARALLNPVSQKVIGRMIGDRDKTIERHRQLYVMLLADVRDDLPVTARAARLVAALGTATEPYEEALVSFQRPSHGLPEFRRHRRAERSIGAVGPEAHGRRAAGL